MLRKRNNKKERVETCRVALASCIISVAVWAALAVPEVALAAKPSKPGNGGEVGQGIDACIVFDDLVGDGIKSDGFAYCGGEKKSKITAGVGRNMTMGLDTNDSNKRTAGRTVWLDLSVSLGCVSQVDISDVDGNRGPDGVCDDCIDDAGPDLPEVRFGDLPSGQKFGYPDRAKLVIKGRDLDGLLVGNTVNTYASLNFDVGGQSWVLWWGPYTSGTGGVTFAPGSDPVTVERMDNDTWRVKTTGMSRAFLYRDNNPPHLPTEHHGQFLVPFAFTAVAITHEETIWGDEPWQIFPGELPCE